MSSDLKREGGFGSKSSGHAGKGHSRACTPRSTNSKTSEANGTPGQGQAVVCLFCGVNVRKLYLRNGAAASSAA